MGEAHTRQAEQEREAGRPGGQLAAQLFLLGKDYKLFTLLEACMIKTVSNAAMRVERLACCRMTRLQRYMSLSRSVLVIPAPGLLLYDAVLGLLDRRSESGH